MNPRMALQEQLKQFYFCVHLNEVNSGRFWEASSQIAYIYALDER